MIALAVNRVKLGQNLRGGGGERLKKMKRRKFDKQWREWLKDKSRGLLKRRRNDFEKEGMGRRERDESLDWEYDERGRGGGGGGGGKVGIWRRRIFF